MRNILFLVITFCFFACNQIKKVEKEFSTMEEAQELLARAKYLAQMLPDKFDTFGFKKAIMNAVVLPATGTVGKVQMTLVGGQSYSIVYLLPDEPLFNSLDKNIQENVLAFTGTNTGGELLFYIMLNPKMLKQNLKSNINRDWSATSMIHEAIHFYQRSVLKAKNIPLDTSAQASSEREQEAYDFQSLFIPIVLKENNMSSSVQYFSLTKEQEKTIYGFKDLIPYIALTDSLNQKKLGSFAQLIFYSNNREICSKFLSNHFVFK